MNNLPYINNSVPYEEDESELYHSIYPWKKVDNLISISKEQYYIQRFNDNQFQKYLQINI